MSNFSSKLFPFLSCSNGPFKSVCFDIGGVLLVPNLDNSHGTPLHPTRFKRILRSHVWFQYLEGKLSWAETLHRVSLDNGFNAEDVQTFVDRARGSLRPVTEILQLVDALGATGKLKLFCMTNAAREDYDYLLATFPEIFQQFDRVFYSAAVGIRKPSFGYFQHVVHETGCKASETIFIDDTLQNVVAAESLGFTGVLVGSEDVKVTVNLVLYHLRTDEERLLAAADYLLRRKGPVDRCPSLTSDGLRVTQQFDHFFIAELLEDPDFLPMDKAPATGTFNFFPPEERLVQRDQNTNAATHTTFPDDLDTTSMALSALYKFSKVDMKTIYAVLDKMLEARNEDGIFNMHFDPSRPRVDTVNLVHISHLFHLAGRPAPVKKTEQFLYNLLKSRAYLRGSMYYPLPDTFLCQLTRLAYKFEEHFQKAGFLELLAQRVSERAGKQGSALALAMRLLACELCGIRNTSDREQLARLQNVDGSWDLCPFYTYSDPKSWFGNKVTTTAFALAALRSGYHNPNLGVETPCNSTCTEA